MQNKDNYGKRMIKEGIKIKKYTLNFNRVDGWKISNTWKPIINRLRKEKEIPY